MHIGNRIKLARVALGLTQVEAAKRCGRTKQQWFQWENGENSPTYRTLCEIAEALDISVQELIGK